MECQEQLPVSIRGGGELVVAAQRALENEWV